MSAVQLARLSAAGSLLFAGLFASLAVTSTSSLAWGQAADSLADVVSAVVLSWLGALALKPGDENHPYGHTRFEPFGALGVAVFSCVLALQVGKDAVMSIYQGATPHFGKLALVPFATKALFKGFIWTRAKTLRSPTARALALDARNDASLCLLAVAGIVAMLFGFQQLDGWLALPVAAWIAWSGLELGLENLNLLVGAAPPPSETDALRTIAQNIPGVLNVHDLRAQHWGASLSVGIHIEVDASMTVRQGHDIGEEVRQALLEQSGVLHVDVHVDPAE